MFLPKFLPSLFFYSPPQAPLTSGVDLLINVTGPDTISADKFKITTILSNNGDKDVTLLNHPTSILTPKFKTNIFGIVSEDGSEPKFGGVFLKWSEKVALEKKDFTVLKAGDSLEIKQDLSGLYDFGQSDAKSFAIYTASVFQLVHESGKVTDYVAYVDPHHVKVTGNRTPKAFSLPPLPPQPGRPMYYGCTLDQEKAIDPGVKQADDYIAEVNMILNNPIPPTARFATWFGEWNATRHEIILKRFQDMTSDPHDTTYDCSTCPKGPYSDAFAYVDANKPGYINLCNAFWTAPVSGTDSKGGTIIHEQSHFIVNGGTQDYAYGQSAAKALAKRNPANAIRNADSTEYFAENTPPIM